MGSLYVVLLAAIAITTGISETGGTSLHSEYDGVLEDPSEIISYKPTEVFLPNERCIWVFRVPEAGGYNVSLRATGFPLDDSQTDTQVILKGFQVARNRSAKFETVPFKSNETYSLPGQQLLTITFHSGADNINSYHGFILNYTADFSTTVLPISNNATDIMHNLGTGVVRYPPEGNFTANDVSSIIFTPRNNVYTPERYTNLSYALTIDAYGCPDTCRCLDAYFFDQFLA